MLAVTRDPYIVYTSNIFAMLGLRALYFVLADFVHRFRYLRTALAIIVCLVACKMLLAGTVDITVGASLAVIVTVLVAALVASVMFPKARQVEAQS